MEGDLHAHALPPPVARDARGQCGAVRRYGRRLLRRGDDAARPVVHVARRGVRAHVGEQWRDSAADRREHVGLVDHGMTLWGTHSVAVPTTGIYDLTLAGNCNGGATGTYLKIVEGNGLLANKVDLAIGFEGNPSLAGATTVHLAAGTTLNMVAGHAGADVNRGATPGAPPVSADV